MGVQPICCQHHGSVSDGQCIYENQTNDPERQQCDHFHKYTFRVRLVVASSGDLPESPTVQPVETTYQWLPTAAFHCIWASSSRRFSIKWTDASESPACKGRRWPVKNRSNRMNLKSRQSKCVCVFFPAYSHLMMFSAKKKTRQASDVRRLKWHFPAADQCKSLAKVKSRE